MAFSGSKPSEETGKPSEPQLSHDHLLDLSFDAIVVRDAHDRIQYWNRGAVEIYGYTPDEALGRIVHDLLKTEFPIPLEQIHGLLERDGRWSGELTHTRKEGRKVTVSSRWALERDAHGAPVAILESNRDISDYKWALQESDERLQFHIENTPLAVVEWGPDFRLSRWSAEAERMFGWRADEVLGKRMNEFRWIYEGDREKVATVSAGLRNGSGTRSVSRNRNYRKDGSVIHCEWYNSSIVDASGKLVSIFSLVLDVTERKSAEEVLRNRESKMRAVFKSLAEGVIFLNKDGAVEEMNETLAEIRGHMLQSLTDSSQHPRWQAVRSDGTVLPVEEQPAVEALRTGKSIRNVEMGVPAADAILKWLSVNAQPVRDHGGELIGAVASFFDITDRKHAEDSLRLSEERYRNVFEHAATGIAITDWDGRFIQCNPAYSTILGYTEEELRSLQFAALVHPDDVEKNLIEIERLKTGTIRFFTIENRYVRKDGQPVWVQKFVSLLADTAGTPAYMVALITDISERKRAEEERKKAQAALGESEAMFRTLANAIPQLCWMANSDGFVFWYNERWYEYTGITPAQMEGWGWQSVHDPKMLPEVIRRWTQSIATGHSFEMVFPLRGKDGVLRPFLTRIVPMEDEHGSVVRWFGTSTEISEQKRTEEELRSNQERLRIALAASGTGTFRWNPSTGELLEFDDNLKTLFGRAGWSFNHTEDFIQCVHPDDLPELRRRVEASQAGADFEMEFRIILPDGGIRWLYDRGKMAFENGHPKYIVGACTDITRRKLVENALMRSEKLAAAGRIASTIAHEINNPLEAVVNLLYLVGSDPALSASTREYVLTAEAELNRVSQMAKRTLSFYRAEIQPAPYSVAHVVEDVLRLFSPILKNRNIQVIKHLDERSEAVGLAREMRQMCTNLFSNAIDAGTKLLIVRVSRRTYWQEANTCAVRITVADTGSGMGPDSLKRIFEPFFTTKNQTGTGLGLWICHEIVRHHGGSIRVRSTPGKGTVFSVLLPACESPMAASKNRSD